MNLRWLLAGTAALLAAGLFAASETAPRGRGPQVGLGTYDAFGRLMAYPGKIEVACPPQDERTAVLLVAGQSNSANFAERRLRSRHRGRVLNHFAGRCYLAGSPTLGAGGEGGEFLTALADHLIDGGYASVVIVAAGIGGTPIARWREGGDLNRMLLATVQGLAGRYRPTQFVWHQGETDRVDGTSADDYRRSFKSMLATLDAAGMTAPVFIAVATICGRDSPLDTPVARAQRELADGNRIRLGADTDALVGTADRYDGCHFSETGQRKAAAAYARAILRQRRVP